MLVEVLSEGNDRPPTGARIVVQLLDTTYADAPARVVTEAVGRVQPYGERTLERIEIGAEVPGNRDYRVRAHVDVDGDGAVSGGDFVSMAAFPSREDQPVRVAVRRV
jgi:hypothetical protein